MEFGGFYMYIEKHVVFERRGKVPYGTYGNDEEFQATKKYRQENFKLDPNAVTLAYRSRTANIECFEFDNKVYAIVYLAEGFTYHHFIVEMGMPEQLHHFLTAECKDYGIDLNEVENDFHELGWNEKDWTGILD
jgi:hypothetical protein